MARKLNYSKLVSVAVGTGAGAVGARVLSKKALSKVNPVLRGVGLVAVGAFGPSVLKMPSMEHVGHGVIAAGAIELAEKFVPAAVSGIGEFDEDEDIELADDGFIDDPINGLEDEQVIGEDVDFDEDEDDDNVMS